MLVTTTFFSMAVSDGNIHVREFVHEIPFADWAGGLPTPFPIIPGYTPFYVFIDVVPDENEVPVHIQLEIRHLTGNGTYSVIPSGIRIRNDYYNNTTVVLSDVSSSSGEEDNSNAND